MNEAELHIVAGILEALAESEHGRWSEFYYPSDDIHAEIEHDDAKIRAFADALGLNPPKTIQQRFDDHRE